MEYNIPIKVRHFKNSAGFDNIIKCPLALALQEYFKTDSVQTFYTESFVKNIYFSHQLYGPGDYREDMKQAKTSLYRFIPGYTIRTITIKSR